MNFQLTRRKQTAVHSPRLIRHGPVMPTGTCNVASNDLGGCMVSFQLSYVPKLLCMLVIILYRSLNAGSCPCLGVTGCIPVRPPGTSVVASGDLGSRAVSYQCEQCPKSSLCAGNHLVQENAGSCPQSGGL